MIAIVFLNNILQYLIIQYATMERGPVQLNIPRDHFYGDLQTTIPASSPIEKSAGGNESLKRAAELLLTAKNPVIVSGE